MIETMTIGITFEKTFENGIYFGMAIVVAVIAIMILTAGLEWKL